LEAQQLQTISIGVKQYLLSVTLFFFPEKKQQIFLRHTTAFHA
jgi:hypothetical protein